MARDRPSLPWFASPAAERWLTVRPESTCGDDLAGPALKRAHSYVRAVVPRRGELQDRCIDSATDAVVWALAEFDPERGVPFNRFAMCAVRKWVRRTLGKAKHRKPNPSPITDGDDPADTHQPASGPIPLPQAVRELPRPLLAVVRLYYVDRLTLRDVGLLLDISYEAVRKRLKRAAALLGGDTPAPARNRRAKRLRRT
jgi:RNA polymerase sigma factor (sigma-70 family)